MWFKYFILIYKNISVDRIDWEQVYKKEGVIDIIQRMGFKQH